MSAGKGEAEHTRAILEERARALARLPAAEAATAGRLEVLVFALSGETYAIETRAVREVARFADFTPVPGTPPLLLGLTNLRGEVLPVFDLRDLVGIAPKGLTDLSRLLVLGDEREELGILADEAHEVRMLGLHEVLDPPDALGAIGRDLLLGVTRDAVIVLDGAALLQDVRLFVRGAGQSVPTAAESPEAR